MPTLTLLRLSDLWIFGLWASVLVSPANGDGESNIQFNRDIRPILAETCFSCHGPDSAARQAELRLDKREVAIERGAIVPGNANSSELIRRIRSNDPSVVMPPPETKKALTSAQNELLERWIRAGAEYQPQWSLIPPTRPAIPDVKLKGWARNPIDQFVGARLAQAGLNAASEADRRTLVRRLALDLTGLPPSPDIVIEFLNDARSDAYERIVDKLMASPHWGEHRARYWLDVARYADTHGIHIDNYRSIWPYRDWVINTFNRNMPFDEFTIENLAGDLLPNATIDNQVGSGFNRCNITTSEGGAIDEEYLVLYARDRVETTCVAWMGLTAGCAVCHDHKFDTLTQREFYQLAAFFNNTTQKAMDGNVRDTAPIVSLLSDSDRARREELEKQISNLTTKIADESKRLRPEFDVWLASASTADIDKHGSSVGDEFAAPLNDDSKTIHYTVRGQSRETPTPSSTFWSEGRTSRKGALSNAGAILSDVDAANFDADQPFSVAGWFKLKNNDPRGTLIGRIDEDHGLRGWDVWIEDRRIGFHLVNHWPTKAIYVRAANEYTPDQWVHLAAAYDGSGKAAGLRIYANGQPQSLEVVADTLAGTTKSNAPLKIGARTHSAPLNGLWIEDVNIFGAA